jgi:hypothetical protein
MPLGDLDSTAVAAVALASVTRPTDTKDHTATLGATAHGQEEDDVHVPSSPSPESPLALSPRAGKRTPSLGLKRAGVATPPGPRLNAPLHC